MLLSFQSIALIIIALLNICTFILYGIDKQRAVKNKYRIPEKTLLTSAFLFGGAGAWLGMTKFRHKTKHTRFKLGVPVAAILTLAAVYVVLNF